MSKREDILKAAETLLWERGYESTSPKLILVQSGAGQGSLYHHFRGKRELALEAMEQHENYLMSQALGALTAPDTEPLERVRRWLSLPRDALRGCRLGRFVHEKSVQDDDELREPVGRYFERLHTMLTLQLAETTSKRKSKGGIEPAEMASLLITIVQGGFVVSQGTADPAHMERALASADRVLDVFFPETASE